MSNVVPVYPGGLFTWTDRVDQQSIDFANDINSIASDLISVESTLGTNPQIEQHPPNGGLPITYTNVSARITDAMTNAQSPVCILRSDAFVVNNTSVGVTTNFEVAYDPFNMFNGTDITISQSGWYMFTVHQNWSWWNDGYSHTYLTTNGNIVDQDLIDWAFAGNVASGGSGVVPPRWQKFGLRTRIAHIAWQGKCSPGERISVISENGTSNTSMKVTYTAFKIHMTKTLPLSVTQSSQ